MLRTDNLTVKPQAHKSSFRSCTDFYQSFAFSFLSTVTTLCREAAQKAFLANSRPFPFNLNIYVFVWEKILHTPPPNIQLYVHDRKIWKYKATKTEKSRPWHPASGPWHCYELTGLTARQWCSSVEHKHFFFYRTSTSNKPIPDQDGSTEKQDSWIITSVVFQSLSHVRLFVRL